ncbi:efflux RND transporter periplasmic adaptor subunit [Acidithiobacillus sp. CV18-2]|uniref:Efflux RND transporter periplasmic adaptor subunit n=1 Tax=Igneacidithiobacillus copahuensis TaxID=2724909 RepID=A0AAE2YSB5_9PROT|nr:efflux RND transporter periplasmic adaptor subunit [Igneacidithiobacillus copahuensis]MBU2753660.1 efflux RND transporter periplasmic adaptor subunit [Acidithiobacillus sp. CV18-3]MBU2757313.1 efflux RND transporter periplasmic adaptor subunit [Acidithiobacillus sp. BN09-2]MBU2776295.1 efflux RND transporter periplasmic adaptor subunit [Acidithiobacillus sp. CV18-2]MBU2796256.1 efflux RND transporter periplasmic adaptor subunit [Acidithiobacillus sp. VAN18-2]MBU2798458.1 efflux RND transpor
MSVRISSFWCLFPCLALSMAPGIAFAGPSLLRVQPAPSLGPLLGARAIPGQVVVLRAQTGGRVEYVAGPVGSPVRSGEVVVGLGTEALRAQQAQAEAAYQAAQVALGNGYSQYQVQLYNYGGSSNPWNPFAWFGQGMAAMMGNQQNPWANYLATLDNRRAAAMQAQTTLQSAAWRIREIEAEIRDAYGVSPFYGVILQKDVNPGDVVQPGQSLLVLGGAGPAQILVEVPTSMSAGLQLGDTLQVRAPNGAGVVRAQIIQIAPEANAQTHTLAVKLALPSHTGIRAGDYVTVRLPAAQSASLGVAIPRSALLPGHSLPSVLVDQNGVTQLRVLRLGEPLANNQVQVLSGLRPGDVIVNDPPAGVGSGYHLQTAGSAAPGADA